MTLEEIFTILNKNITANNGTLKLTAQTISSPGITDLFDKYLLNTDLVADNAEVKLNAGENVTVKGIGNSFVFAGTEISALVFTVDNNGIPAMTVNAAAIIKPADGWSFGKSFPALKYSNWDSFYDPGKPEEWLQYIFFSNAGFVLSADGLIFSGALQMIGRLQPLSVLFHSVDKIELRGSITINKGTDGFIADASTAVPEMHLEGAIGTAVITLGTFEPFTLSFSMESSAYIIPAGINKGMPVPVVEMLIGSSILVNQQKVALQTLVGTQAGALNMRALLPGNIDTAMSELISLANNENILALMPANIPVIYDFVLAGFEITFNTRQNTLNLVTLQVATPATFNWALIPGFFTLSGINISMAMSYIRGGLNPSLTVDGSITIGSGTGAVDFILTASFPDYIFTGSLNPETPLDLRSIMVYLLGDTIGQSLPETLKLGTLGIAIDPKNSSYSLESVLNTDLELPLPLLNTSIILTAVSFNIEYVAGIATGSLTGRFLVGSAPDSPAVLVTAAYDGTDNSWVFSGELEAGKGIDLKQLIDKYLPAEFHQFNPIGISIDTLFASFTQAAVTTYNFKLGASWEIDLGTKIPAEALVEIASGDPASGDPFTGYIQGSLDLGNIIVGVRVDFDSEYNDYTFFLNGFEAKLTHNEDGDNIIAFGFTDETTLGGLIQLLVNAAIGQTITLPSPWDVMNNIKLKDYELSFNINKNKIGLSYITDVNLGFINIRKFTLYYTYSDDPKVDSIVEIAITEGTFIGGLPLPGPWNLLQPDMAPAVPGLGESLFRLDFLALGQHVSIKNTNNAPASVADAVALLKTSFESKKKSPEDPISDTGLEFNSASNWLIGAQFVIVDTFSIGVVFFDPDLYGLSLFVNGPKGQVFDGLKFEILYKKVSDTVGVYQAYLKLPDALRQIEFGAVSVTLPSLKIYIYTNGDFKVDFGFPVNEDFSESFGLCLLPFIGAGGFYFGVLSADTAQTVPAATNGNFSPVIIFGVAMLVGVGKTIDKGIFKAGFSIVVQGSLEGTFAQFNHYNGLAANDNYYFVLGKIAIAGHIYGAVDLIIVSAEIDVYVYISARVVFESYEVIIINLSAGVSVSLRVRINLGLFSISVGVSYSTTVEESFSIGSSSPKKPWITQSLYEQHFRPAKLRALDDTPVVVIPAMNWQPIIPTAKVELEILYVPQFTASTAEGSTSQTANAVAMLYLESAIDQPTTKKQVLIDGVITEADYPFTKFAKGAFLWVLAAWYNKTETGMPVDELIQKEVSAEILTQLIDYFGQNSAEPFSVDEIFTFMENYLTATVMVPPRDKNSAIDKSVSILPILPNLVLETPVADIYFNNQKAEYTYNQAQLTLIHNYFKELAVRNRGGDTTRPPQILNEEKQSLASFMLIDYLALLAKECSQRGIDRLAQMPVTIEEGDSIDSIVARHPLFGISAIELAFSNRTRNVAAGAELRIPGAVITTSNITHVATGEQSLLDIANKFGINILDLIAENTNINGLFPANSKILVPAASAITIADLVAAMEANHDFEHLSGLSANIMLQGLRVPLPADNSGIGKPEAMYKVSGQQIDASALVPGQSLSLKMDKPLGWLNLGTPGGTKLSFTLLDEDYTALQALQKATLNPVILELAASTLCQAQPRKYTLPSHITWQVPAALALANGDNQLFDNVNPGIWAFENSLLALLNSYDAVTPKVQLLKQIQNTKTSTGQPVPVNNYSWSTKINIRLKQVKFDEDPSMLMPNVYELHGVDQSSVTLLKNLIEHYTARPGKQIINQIDILYAREPAQQGQQAPPVGLQSDSLDNTLVYLLQTNLSTLSNPAQAASVLNPAQMPGTQANLIGMSQLQFLQYIWESAIVGTGGYYLYYQVKDSKNGLPDYLFNGDAGAEVSLVITYNIIDDIITNFLNSVVIKEPVDIIHEILYIETVPQQIAGVKMATNDTLKIIAKRYNTTIADIAKQNKQVSLKQGINLNVPLVTATHQVAPQETLESLGKKYGLSVVALAHANKNIAHLFEEPLTFDSSIEVKVATVPPGNIGFTMIRENPDRVPGLDDAAKNMQELYNLLGYNIADNADFDASLPGLPVSPADNRYKPVWDIDAPVRPTSFAANLQYNRILPVYRFVKAITGEVYGAGLPPAKDNPYRATGKTALIDMQWQDIFGNLTSFSNTSGPGIPVTLPPVKIGYIDPVIGLNNYPDVAASYIINKSAESTPHLYITLAFNPTSYLPVEKITDETWKKRAAAAVETYKQIYYQLLQSDVTVSVANSIEGKEPLQLVGGGLKETLIFIVSEIYQYLNELLNSDTNPFAFYAVKEGDTISAIAATYNTTAENIKRINPSIPADGKLIPGQNIIITAISVPANKIIEAPVSDKNPSSLFALVTTITIQRDINLVDDEFKDEPSVVAATSALSPNLTVNNTAAWDEPGNQITIQEFAKKLQEAFPELRAASGTPQIGAEDNIAAEIWIARFNDTANGIQFSIQNTGSPYYFALLPLSTHLLSREKVKIYPYVTGTGISRTRFIESSFGGIDIEKLAETCLDAIDVFLQPDIAIHTWQVEHNSDKNLNTALTGEVLQPYQYILNAKKALAENIVKRISTVLDDGQIPSEQDTNNAGERLMQELLINLSNAYTIDTIVQYNVDVKSQYADPIKIAPRLFGKVIDPGSAGQTDKKAYAFSTTRFSLQNSGPDKAGHSWLTILFNTKKENNLEPGNSYFPIELQYQINSIEHNIQDSGDIKGYQSSSWLTFILPFKGPETNLGNLKIPIPLRAYPTAPSLTSQGFKGFKGFEDKDAGFLKAGKDKLQEAKEWDYSYTYDYLRAQQDTINTDIILNVPANTLSKRLFTDEDDPDLFAALLQFSAAYPGIRKDFNLYLSGQLGDADFYIAIQSFAWLVKRVAKAWGKWDEDKKMYGGTAGGETNYKYEIIESEKTIDSQPALLVIVVPQTGTIYKLPDVDIEGFTAEPIDDTPERKSYVYYSIIDDKKTYLSPGDAQKLAQRVIGYKKLNIINEENIWSGISVVRNKILVPGIPTDSKFIYTTPTVRFVSVLTPLLDLSTEINMAGYTDDKGPQPLTILISNFLKALFKEIATETTVRQIKILTSYRYNMLPGIADLFTDIPISLLTPFDFRIPTDWNTSLCPVSLNDITVDTPIVCQLATMLQQWFAGNQPVVIDAKFKFDISLFSGLSNTQLPIFRIRDICLYEKDIKWS